MNSAAVKDARKESANPRVVVLASDHATDEQPRVFIVKLPRDVLRDVLARAHAVSSVHEAGLVERVIREADRDRHPRVASAVAPGISASQQEMLTRAKAFIDEHLDDEELSPGSVADGIFVSKRYLYMLFEHETRSVSRHIIVRRLQVIAQRLCDARFSHLSAADIALRLGFKDTSHFARAFKSEYGLTPGRYRAEARPAGAA